MRHKLLFSVIALLISFCGISYQFLISRVLIQFSQNEILNQSVTLGFYLLSLGIGAALADRFFQEKNAQNLFVLEISVSSIGIILVPLIYSLHFIVNIFFSPDKAALFYGIKAVFSMQLFTILIGLITGCELPLLMSIAQSDRKISISNSKVLALSYFGTLLGALFSSGLVIPALDFISHGILVGLLTLIAATLVVVTGIREIKKVYALLVVIPIALAFSIVNVAPKVEQFFLKGYYVNMKIPVFSRESLTTVFKFLSTLENIERYMTNYQIIDITSDNFMAKYEKDTGLILYLNNQIQFGRRDYEMYHETMVHGALNITQKKPRHVLVLGGGDGLILSELIKLDGIESITQVELDPQMIDLATYHPGLRSMNRSVYGKSSVNVIYGDGFSFIRKTDKKFDTVFIDFPFPTSFDLSKLYSVEFYESLKKVITKDGFFVFDGPVLLNSNRRPTVQDVFLSTLSAAHLDNIFIYGLLETFYIVSLDNKPMHFHYETLPRWLKNQTIVNLSTLSNVVSQAEISKKYVNSIFRPQNFVFK